jgi:hypothetical protein
MLPVTSLNGIKVGDGEVGPIFTRILNKWSMNVNVDIKEQIKFWKNENTTASPTPYQFKNKN